MMMIMMMMMIEAVAKCSDDVDDSVYDVTYMLG